MTEDHTVPAADPGQIVRTADPGQIVRTADPGQIVRTADGDQIVRTADGDQIVRTADPGQIVRTADGDQIVRTADGGPVRVITLNRPAARNALSGALNRALYAALTDADADEAVSAVVLTGTDPAFCAGVDLKEAARNGLRYFEEFQSHSCIAAVAAMHTPVVGAINGATFTGGLEIALGCDFLVASERAVFADTHARVGILPGGGMTARLPQLVGAAMARRLSMTGEVVDAVRAERIGLVTEVVPHERLLHRAVELATQIADVPRSTMRSLKRIYTTGSAAVTDPALAAEEAIAVAQHRDFDALEGTFRAVTQRNKEQMDPG